MSQWRRDLLEWISPGRVRRSAIPPLEAGLRPDDRLDRAPQWGGPFDPLMLDDVALLGNDLVVTAANKVLRWDGERFVALVELPDRAGAITPVPDGVVVAVDGLGLVRVFADGTTEAVSTDTRLAGCVTAMTALVDGSLLVCIGSTETTDWARNLVSRRATGKLLRVSGGNTEVVATELAWPAGVAADGEDGFYLSLSAAYRIERRSLASSRKPEVVLGNLPASPGRIRATDVPGEWWVAAPYMRNRATELLLEDDDLLEEMVNKTEPDSWLVPRLSVENHFRAPLQVGQIRVLGEIKPWAPPRTYGLVFKFAKSGRVIESAHSRADGARHGVTGVQPMPDGSLVVVCRGAGAVLTLGVDGS
ncbi:hypothetical protein ACNTMW_13875 [Planosporangium sp. 12N6]|uniref:hypothetical protein n=1 Tax=Planosporangium spinosum TaxID=3402278 RepID=UPI003CE8E9F3